jgi:hypothetical protein
MKNEDNTLLGGETKSSDLELINKLREIGELNECFYLTAPPLLVLDGCLQKLDIIDIREKLNALVDSREYSQTELSEKLGLSSEELTELLLGEEDSAKKFIFDASLALSELFNKHFKPSKKEKNTYETQ